MKLKRISPLIIGLLISVFSVQALFAQFEHEHKHKYFPETDPLVLEKLDDWQDLKFGLLMHWGAYSQWGIVESWSLCPEDYGWCRREKGENPENYFDYKKEYENLITTFNPIEFNPDAWAEAAKLAGMKYLVFTTKHHDGFCMWDTKETDYKVTGELSPFRDNERADITGEIFDAFRKQDMWIGAYFSKPDWHNENYWWPKFPPQDRNVNYDPELYPERWEKFTQFTHNQILELMTDYGKVDILWLDGGWVKKTELNDLEKGYHGKLKESPSGFLKNRYVNQDIRMDELVDKARIKQPGLIVVDRAVPGPNQNYLTPENKVPEKMLPYPWESCIIAGGSWAWVDPAKANYMTPRQTVHMLSDIVSKGGNLLLNIAPGPHGDWHPKAYELLTEMGKWMKVNSEAIYGSRAIAPYKFDNICLTQNKDDNAVYAIYLAGEQEIKPPSKIILKNIQPSGKSKITMMGAKSKLKWKKSEEGIVVVIPESLQKNPPCDHAWVLKITEVGR